MSDITDPITPNQQYLPRNLRCGARPGSVPLGNASGSGVGVDLVCSVGLQMAATIGGSNSQYSWASGAPFKLRYWPEAINSSIEKVPAACKGAKLGVIAGESSKVSLLLLIVLFLTELAQIISLSIQSCSFEQQLAQNQRIPV
ncbi:hypothetical protein M231_03810 [Tremella mesenterica]|uniref:Uncharacterized protein n=1 Tax=Tremella mesenterica TaxID=5217 RepID=A0A4Q1BM23_TREME|nr:hypothetical protein M231_03810 [Tremella mesenterica]